MGESAIRRNIRKKAREVAFPLATREDCLRLNPWLNSQKFGAEAYALEWEKAFMEESARLEDEASENTDSDFLRGVKAGIAAVRRELDKCGSPCPQCYENLEAIDPEDVEDEG